MTAKVRALQLWRWWQPTPGAAHRVQQSYIERLPEPLIDAAWQQHYQRWEANPDGLPAPEFVYIPVSYSPPRPPGSQIGAPGAVWSHNTLPRILACPDCTSEIHWQLVGNDLFQLLIAHDDTCPTARASQR